MSRFSPIDEPVRIPSDHIICTSCHQDAGEFPDLSNLPLKTAIQLIQGWMCTDCLDEFERENGYCLT